jgi:hypothetical protein
MVVRSWLLVWGLSQPAADVVSATTAAASCGACQLIICTNCCQVRLGRNCYNLMHSALHQHQVTKLQLDGCNLATVMCMHCSQLLCVAILVSRCDSDCAAACMHRPLQVLPFPATSQLHVPALLL